MSKDRKQFKRDTGPKLEAQPAEQRKAFSIPRPIQGLEGKTYCVISGYSARPIDGGHYPHISTHNIMRAFGLNPRECYACDEREYAKVEAAKKAGLKLVTVEEFNLGKMFS